MKGFVKLKGKLRDFLLHPIFVFICFTDNHTYREDGKAPRFCHTPGDTLSFGEMAGRDSQGTGKAKGGNS